MSIETIFKPGTPLVNRSMSLANAGYILSSKPAEPGRSMLSGTGMVPIETDYEILWYLDGQPHHISEESDVIVNPWVQNAADRNFEPKKNLDELVAKVRAKQELERIQREEAHQQARREREAFLKEAHEKCPDWAKAVIVGTQIIDKSNLMEDYHGHETGETVILAFSSHTRDLFPEMRKAAANAPETAHLADAPESVEHREKYSMGHGYYLKDGYRDSTGWEVSKQKLYDGADSIPTGRWCLPAEVEDNLAVPVGEFSIEEHYHTKRDCQIWIVIPEERKDRETFVALRSQAKDMGGWYSKAWGSTPGGFAFLDEETARKFAGGSKSEKSKQVSAGLQDKFRELADNLQPQIDNKFGDRLTNTPKRMYEAAAARQEGERLVRTQQSLRNLADLHEVGEVPPELAKIRSKKAVYDLMGEKMDRSNQGYYDVATGLGEPSTDSKAARMLWAMLTGKTEEEKRADELRSLIEGLQFSNIPGYFPTPKPIVQQMLDLADIQPGHRVLEPEAGSAAIADEIQEQHPDAKLDVMEVNHTLRKILKAKGHDLIGDDWMAHDVGPYDRIVMNPPFEQLQDVDHVLKAYHALKEGGRLVAIMFKSWTYNQQRKAADFRNWFEQVDGYKIDLPEGSFKESGTGVHTVMVVIEKQG